VKKSTMHGTVAGLKAALERLQAVNEGMTASQAITFLSVAMFEGRSMREYCDMLNLPQSTMSRHLLDLGLMRRNRSPGLGLIDQQEDNDDRRKNIYRLSARGKALIEAIEQDIQKEPVKRSRFDDMEGYSEVDLAELNAAWDRLVEGLLSAPNQSKLDWIVRELGAISMDSIPADYAARLAAKFQTPGYEEHNKSQQDRIAEELRFKFDQGLRGRALVRDTFLHLWLYGVDGKWEDCR